MRVLMLSVDAKIFEKGSDVRSRMISYGSLFDELRIVIYTKPGFREEKIASNVFIYPTNSRTKLFYFWDAYKISKKIIGNWKLPVPSGAEGEIGNSLITSQDAVTNIVGMLLKWRFKLPLQVQIHTDFLSPYFKKESLKNFVRYIVQKLSLKQADCVRVVSEKIKNSICRTSDVQQNIRCPVTVLPIYIDVQKIKNAQPVVLPKKFDFTILWVGRLEREKNCSLALEAFAQLVKHTPNTGLVIIGDGREREKLELRIKNYELSNNVIMVGWKNDIAGYYKSADILVVTSWYEGYGLQMVEARIAGIPVIAPDVGVAREVGAYITDHTAGSIARMLSRFYMGNLSKPSEYEYPYKNKERYLELYKKSFEQCRVVKIRAVAK